MLAARNPPSPVRENTGQAERAEQGVGLLRRECAHPVENRAEQQMQGGEGQLGLRFHACDAKHMRLCGGGGVVQQGPLADARLAAHDQRAGTALEHVEQHLIDNGLLRRPAVQHGTPFPVLSSSDQCGPQPPTRARRASRRADRQDHGQQAVTERSSNSSSTLVGDGPRAHPRDPEMTRVTSPAPVSSNSAVTGLVT
ncbi:hypothetical protein GCM10009850_092620 [Nonomuraea monospora]|uniref:Uncharacterized protein n=1 Tax=Nonomuraea monospora TaxID=568818 RepID=A0ABN3CWL7_9ACTN